MDIRTVRLSARDGYALSGTVFDASGDRVLLVASAMGVRRRYYEAFARSVAESGITVLTFDYRGIGDSRPASLRGFGGTMVDWGRHDIAGAIDWIQRELRPRSLVYAGHSAGGQLAGLAPNADAVERFLFVCVQSGYWRHWPGIRKVGLGALWLAMPVISRGFGHFPSRLVGLGSEDLPREVASQWARWGRHRDYLFRDVDPNAYRRITAPILAYSFRDDHYAPDAAVADLLSRYSHAPVTRMRIEERGLGHFDFFRKAKAEWLWPDAIAWLRGNGAS